MAENESTFTLNLDAEQFTSAANQAASALTSVGEAGESISKLVDTLESVGGTLAIITTAFLALDKIVESVFDAEKIKQVEDQFNKLSQSAGVYGDTLKKAMAEASGGWTTDTENMQHANKAMIELETGVDKIPDLMSAARKATAVMGGDFLDNFDRMTQAVATGNVRQLRHLGIIIDQQKAYREYAVSIGATVDTLSEAGKQQAILNAVLAQTSDKFKNVNADAMQNTSLAKQFSAAWHEISEIITVVMAKFASPIISKALEELVYRAKEVKTAFQDWFGHGSEQTEAHLARTKDHVQQLYAQIQELQKKLRETNDPRQAEGYAAALAKVRAQYNNIQKDLTVTQEKEKELDKQREQFADKHAKRQDVDLQLAKKQRAEIEKETAAMDHQIAALDKQLTQEEIKNMDSVEQAEKLYNKQKVQQAQETQNKINEVLVKQDEIEAKIAEGKIQRARRDEKQELADLKAHMGQKLAILNGHESQELALTKRTNNQIVQLNKLKDKQMERDDAELERMREQALDNYQAKSENVFQGVGRAFENMSEKNKAAMSDWGAFGTMTTDAFASHSTAAISAWGAGQETATQAAKGAFMGMVGDMATHYGEMMLLASVFPPNPAGLAAGAALIALGGYLSSQTGTSTKGGAYSGGGQMTNQGGGQLTNPNISDYGTPATPSAGIASQTNNGPSAVHITVQGSVFDTQATQTRIADLVRNAQDSTDFSIAQVNGSV